MSPDPVTITSPPDATRTGAGGAPLPPATPLDAPPGFTLDREIGAGGMGVVYLARQQGLNRPVALKTVRAGTTLDARALIRFLAEAEAIASIRHPNVVEVYAFGEHAGRPYLALEYCPGGDLTTVSKAEQTRDANWFRRTADLMAKIADGVNAAHAQGIVHRDLKPANVLLANSPGEPAASAAWVPKVTDFGLAKRGLGSDLTHTQDVLGTPAYMAPEQASGRTKFVGPEADVWALGVMLYELLSGTRPFDGSNPLEVMAAVAKADVPKVRDRFPTVPRDLALVTHKCLSADPRDRYPTAGALATDLRNWLDGKPVSARPAGVIESAVKWVKRNKRVALTGLAVLLTMATATAVSLGFGLDANEQRKQAKAETKRAEDEKQAAIDAREEAVAANRKTERALARASVSSFLANRFAGEAENNSRHWELTETRQTNFNRMLLEELVGNASLSDEEDLLCAELVHSLVGLDPKQKEVVDRVLGERIRDPNTRAKLRDYLTCTAALEGYWDGSASDLTERVASRFKRDDVTCYLMADALAACADRTPERARELAELMIDRVSTDDFSYVLDAKQFRLIIRLLPSTEAESLATRAMARVQQQFKELNSVVGVRRWELKNYFADSAGCFPPAERERVLEELTESYLADYRKISDPQVRVNFAHRINDYCDVVSHASATKFASLVIPDLLKVSVGDSLLTNGGYVVLKLARWLPPNKGCNRPDPANSSVIPVLAW